MRTKLDPWQEEALAYKGNLLICTGRRVGKTFIISKKSVNYMYEEGKNVVVVSLTEDQAILIVQMAKQAAENNPKIKIAKGKDKPTLKTLTIYSKNGRKAKLISRPVGSSGDSLRGYEAGVLVVDEASRMPPLFWMAAKPIVLMQQGQIWMCSTPAGKEGYFWEKYNEAINLKSEDARFHVIYTTTEKVVNERPISESWTEAQKQGALKQLAEDKKDMSELEYGQEYLGLFMEDIARFFDDEWLKKVLILKPKDRNEGIGKNFLGVDIARMGDDESAFAIVNRFDGKCRHLYQETTKKTFTPQTEENILRIGEFWKAVFVGIDAGAGTLGVSVLDHLKLTKIRHKVIAMNNRSIAIDDEGKKKQRLMKNDMYYNLLAMGERGEIKLINSDAVRASLAGIQVEYKDGKERIFGKKGAGGDHIAESIVRAAEIAKREKALKLWAR